MGGKTIRKGAVVITDLWWAEQVIPEVFFDTKMFYVGTPESATRLLKELFDRGVKSLWMIAAPETQSYAIDHAFINLDLARSFQILSETRHSYHDLRIVNLEFAGSN